VVAGNNSGNISVTGNSTCGSSQAQLLAVTVNPAPVPVITESGNLLSTGAYNSYQWHLYGNLITGATSQTYLAPQPGHYTVVVTDANGCKGTSTVLPLSAPDVFIESISVYPSPVTNELHIDGLREQLSYTLITTTGIKVKQGTLLKGAAVISTEQLAAGVYILEIGNGMKIKVLKY